MDWERPSRKSENYGDAEFLDEQPRLIDLIPTRLPVVFLLFLLGLIAVAGIEALYVWMPQSPMAVNGRVEALDLEGRANLGVWFSSVVLAAGGVMAILVFSIRRYRVDDYHGHYRVWLWAALCCFLLSMEQTANLRAGLAQMALRLTGTPLYGDGSLWWVIAYGFLFGAVGTRLLVDMFPCRLSTLALLAAVGCWGLCAACAFGFVSMEGHALQVMVAAGSRHLGNLLILAAISFHARHVRLDAEGLLPPRKQKKAASNQAEDQEESDLESAENAAERRTVTPTGSSILVHPPHGVPRPTGLTIGTTSASPPALPPRPSPPQSVTEAESSLKRKLTKAERKALRQRLERMQAERQKRAG